MSEHSRIRALLKAKPARLTRRARSLLTRRDSELPTARSVFAKRNPSVHGREDTVPATSVGQGQPSTEADNTTAGHLGQHSTEADNGTGWAPYLSKRRRSSMTCGAR